MQYETPVDALAAAISEAGGQSALALELSRLTGEPFTQARVWNWIRRDGGVPVEFCALIERTSNGLVRRWDLRPNDWHLIWPELVKAKGAPPLPEKEPTNA